MSPVLTQFRKKMKGKRFSVITEATIILLFATSGAQSVLGIDDPRAGLPP